MQLSLILNEVMGNGVMADEVMGKGNTVDSHRATEMAGKEEKGLKGSEEEKEVDQGPQNGEAPDAERENCGQLSPNFGGKSREGFEEKTIMREDVGGKLLAAEKSTARENLNGDDSDHLLPPPVVRDGRRYLSIQR